MFFYRLGSTIFSFECLFVLFLFAGQYKADPRFSWIPVDLTALFFTLSIFAGLFILWRRQFRIDKRSWVLIIIYFALLSYIIASLVWSPGNIYATQKTFYFATLTFWSLIAPATVIANNYRRLYRFFCLLVLFSGWISLETLLAVRESEAIYVKVLGGSYLGTSRIVGLGTIIVLVYLLYLSQSLTKKLAAFIVFIIFMGVLLLLGGRGPLLAVIFTMLIPLFLSIRLSRNYGLRMKHHFILIMGIFISWLGTLSYLLATGQSTTTLTLHRLLAFLRPGGGKSVSVRLNYYIDSVNLWLTNPWFGHGIGSWPILTGKGDVQDYPHNLFLEVISELGIMGLIILIIMIYYSLKILIDWNLFGNNPIQILIFMFFCYTFINTLISGDITSNRFFFVSLGLMALPSSERRENKNV